MPLDKLSHPPLDLVTFELGIPSNLKIAESRSIYFDLVKEHFPKIIFPEIKTLNYDWADVIFRNEKNDAQLRVSTNYFVYETSKYDDVVAFWRSIKEYFLKFVSCYQITSLTSLRVNYQNIIRLTNQQVGESFNDYLSLEVEFKDHQSRKLMACDGMFIYSTDDGNVMKIDIRPRQNPQTQSWDSLSFALEFSVLNKNIAVDKDLTSIKTIFDKAHNHIESVFRRSLTDRYYEAIK
jgi:uncharacterized protein (TIGR04255 family)